ncbi:MAG TPA: aminotransferase class III-fold pyridoxal phosphate-dependent enzyme [Candidatus Acidoferrales bacterium]|nr:aminotransferase class III-fold pyridoxal phosphate-dependent enzyme [Candidatus Acidoferrales bacterium]
MTELLAAADAATWRDRDAELISPAYHRYSDLVVESAEGAHLHTIDGRDVLDFGCGIGVTNLGHRHPAVVAAVHAQVDRLWHTSVTAYHPQMIEAAAALVSVTPPGLDSVFLTNSGAEAVEGAMKLARRATGRSEIIAFVGGFHGRTYGALSLTASKAAYRRGVGPLLPGVHHIRYPYCFRYCTHAKGAACDLVERELQLLFSTTVAPDTVAAIIVEPVQGEGGYVVPPAPFLPMLRKVCDEHGILLVADEVQSGFGRTGRMFAVDHTAVEPDIMCLAKALGNGMPIAAFVARHNIMKAFNEGEHGTTYGGNAIACAAAVAVIATLTNEHVPERADRLGRIAMERVHEWQATVPALADVRGLGMMIGLEFMQNGAPATDLVDRISTNALARDLLLLSCGIDGNVIRLIPPLTIPETELHAGLDILEAAMREEVAR